MARARTGLVGAAGEYYVAAELSRRGWLATVTIKNAPGTDVLAQHADTGAMVAIQTKTTSGSDSFVLGLKDERPTVSANEWYVLVSLRQDGERPEFFVMPRNHVAAAVYVEHRDWLSKPGRGGRVRRENPMRNLYPRDLGHYSERWDALVAPTSAFPYGLADWVIEAARTIGLSPDHPDAAMFT